MNKILKVISIFILIAGILNVLSPITKCDENKLNMSYVGGDGFGNYSYIQDAINDSENGTIIYVYNGVYYENLLINKSINMTGEDKYHTIINGKEFGTVITLIANNVSVNGFTIKNSSLEYTECLVSGLKIYSSYNVISNNIISNAGRITNNTYPNLVPTKSERYPQ